MDCSKDAVLVNEQFNVIAIDGPAASGKTTIGKLLAERLGYLFLDTGSMYRAVTLAALQKNVDVNDETAVTRVAEQMNMDILPVNGEQDGRLYTVLLDGKDVTWLIRSPAVDGNVSQVSKYLAVRRIMVERQRQFGLRGQVVMVGRDIGTVVMPDAPLKLYVTASAEERARRRHLDRQEQGHDTAYDDILADVVRRDKIDTSREHSPLRPAADAVQIDTTGRPPELIVDKIMQMIEDRPVISNQ